MNSKQVLSKIAKMLNLTEEVQFTDAKDAKGNILQSPTFDVGEGVEVVSEDGTKTPAPDGEHQISLKDSEGNEVLIRIETKDGKIVERANVEEEESETDMEDEMPVPTEEIAMADETAKQLPNTTSSDDSNEMPEPDTEKPLIALEDLSYRISELEKKIQKMEEAAEEMTHPKEAKMEEVDVPKLDGAPIEENSTNLSALYQSKSKNKVGSSQNSFLSKLYN
jgi:hypothetical protein